MDILDMKPRKLMDFWKYKEDGNILAGTKNGTYELDQIASYVWERCNGQQSVKEICNSLAAECKMENQMETVQNDIIRLLEEWKYNQFIILNYNPLHAFSEYDEETSFKLEAKSKSVDLLLIAPPSPNPTTGMNLKVQGTFPLGVGYISSFLRKSGYKVEIINLWPNQTDEKSVKLLIEKSDPKVLGISAMTDNFLNGVIIAQIAKQARPDITVVFGGPHATFTDMESMERHSVIDLIARNEGEYTMLELMDYYVKGEKNLDDIKGITYRENGCIKRNPSRPFIKNLDELPFPDRPMDNLQSTMVGIQTSRGCPGACIFCVASSMAGGYYRVRSAENVFQEIKYLYDLGARKFFFQDDTFTADIKRLHAILDLIVQNKLEIEWSAESRVDIIDEDPEIFIKLARAGCTNLQFGVEAGSQDILNKLKKNIKVEQIFNTIESVVKAGIGAICTMLIGHPYDTKESIEQSVEFAEKELVGRGAFVLFSIVCPYPGSQIREKALQYGITIQDASYNDYFVSNALIDTEHLNTKEIRSLYFDGMRKLINTNFERNPQEFASILPQNE